MGYFVGGGQCVVSVRSWFLGNSGANRESGSRELRGPSVGSGRKAEERSVDRRRKSVDCLLVGRKRAHPLRSFCNKFPCIVWGVGVTVHLVPRNKRTLYGAFNDPDGAEGACTAPSVKILISRN